MWPTFGAGYVSIVSVPFWLKVSNRYCSAEEMANFKNT